MILNTKDVFKIEVFLDILKVRKSDFDANFSSKLVIL